MVLNDDLGTGILQDPVARFEDFFRMVEEPVGTFIYLNKIKYLIAEETSSLYVDHEHLNRYDIQLARDLHENPSEYLKKANQALVNILHEQSGGSIKLTDEFFVRFYNLDKHHKIKLRKIRSQHMERLYSISGSLIRSTNVRPQITNAEFECKVCGATHTIQQIDDELTYPNICNVGGCKNAKKSDFRLAGRTSEFIDWQQVRVQEMPEELSSGNVPRFLDALLLHDLVDTCRPGDRVTMVGTIKIVPIKKGVGSGPQRVFQMLMHVNNIYSEEEENESLEISEEDEQKIKELAKDPMIHDKITRSIAPDIYGMNEIKKAAALVLFGGVHKTRKTGHKMRGDIHILAMGDPGTGKSQIIKSVSRLAPRAIYTSGQGSTAAGLTAAVLKDESSGGMVLEAGALVLADGGVAAIDEFDKMKTADRVAIHEAMEQQTVSIAKAGIVATLNARTSIIAAANPKFGRYDDSVPAAENINLQPSILSRFDLIFIVKDEPIAENDNRVADHILKLHMPEEMLGPDDEVIEAPIDLQLLKKYIKYAESECQPALSPEAANRIKDFYLKMRRPAQGDEEAPIPIVARTLEGLVRLSEAHAKMALRKEIIIEDVNEVIKLQEYSMKQVGWDADRQVFDVDTIQLGKSKSKVQKIKRMYQFIKNLQEEKNNEPVDEQAILERAEFDGIKEDEARKLIEELKKDAQILEKRNGKFVVINRT